MSFRAFDNFTRRGRGDFRAFGRGRRGSFRVPRIQPPEAFDVTDSAEDRIYGSVKDRALARRVRALQDKFPAGSLPELVVMDWLDRRRVVYRYQVPFGGGRSVRGGAVLDFVLPQGGGMLVWRVQGDYWHGKSAQEQYDYRQRVMLQRMKVEGQRIAGVVDLWSRRIEDQRLRDETLQAALRGVEMGR